LHLQSWSDGCAHSRADSAGDHADRLALPAHRWPAALPAHLPDAPAPGRTPGRAQSRGRAAAGTGTDGSLAAPIAAHAAALRVGRGLRAIHLDLRADADAAFAGCDRLSRGWRPERRNPCSPAGSFLGSTSVLVSRPERRGLGDAGGDGADDWWRRRGIA